MCVSSSHLHSSMDASVNMNTKHYSIVQSFWMVFEGLSQCPKSCSTMVIEKLWKNRWNMHKIHPLLSFGSLYSRFKSKLERRARVDILNTLFVKQTGPNNVQPVQVTQFGCVYTLGLLKTQTTLLDPILHWRFQWVPHRKTTWFRQSINVWTKQSESWDISWRVQGAALQIVVSRLWRDFVVYLSNRTIFITFLYQIRP